MSCCCSTTSIIVRPENDKWWDPGSNYFPLSSVSRRSQSSSVRPPLPPSHLTACLDIKTFLWEQEGDIITLLMWEMIITLRVMWELISIWLQYSIQPSNWYNPHHPPPPPPLTSPQGCSSLGPAAAAGGGEMCGVEPPHRSLAPSHQLLTIVSTDPAASIQSRCQNWKLSQSTLNTPVSSYMERWRQSLCVFSLPVTSHYGANQGRARAAKLIPIEDLNTQKINRIMMTSGLIYYF